MQFTFFLIRSREYLKCPICENSLNVIGSRKRGLIEYDGTKKKLIIRRLKCTHCNRIHHELPEEIVPYKRYSSEAIEKSICGIDDKQTCEFSIIKDWKLWFYLLEEHLESSLEALKMQFKELQNEILLLQPLKNIKNKPNGWLKRLVRIIVNVSSQIKPEKFLTYK